MGLVRVELVDLLHNAEHGQSLLILGDPVSSRAVTLFLGSRDVEQLIFGLARDTYRPHTFRFFSNVLEGLEVTVEEVRIVAIENDTFIARAFFRSGEKLIEIDARPSDSIALALCAGKKPILIEEVVLDQVGVELAPGGKPPVVREGFASVMRLIDPPLPLLRYRAPAATETTPDKPANLEQADG